MRFCSLRRRLEIRYIQGKWCIPAPLEGLGSHIEAMINLWQPVAEPGEQGAQVLKRLLVGGIRPEKERELRLRDRNGALQTEASQQALKARLFKSSHRLIASEQAKSAEQFEVQGFLCPLSA